MTTGLVIFIVLVAAISFLIFVSVKYEISRTDMFYHMDYKVIDETISNLINEEMNNFRLLNIEYQKDPYITEEIQMTMITNITAAVYQKIINSELLKYQVGLLYNIKNKESFTKLIASKVSIFVIAYTKEVNTRVIK